MVNQSKYKDHKMTDVIPFKKPEEVSAEVLAEHGISDQAERVEDILELGNAVTAWHFKVIQELHHKAQLPPNVGIDIPTGELDKDGKDICIDGNDDHRAGFIVGMHYALELLDTFPIKGVPTDEPEDES